MVEIVCPFNKRLEEALHYRHMTPAELSRRTGIAEATLSQYKKGLSTPKRDRAFKIANALGVDPAWLYGFDTGMFGEKPADNVTDFVVHLSKDETVLIEKFRTADARTQQMVRLALFMDNEK